MNKITKNRTKQFLFSIHGKSLKIINNVFIYLLKQIGKERKKEHGIKKERRKERIIYLDKKIRSKNRGVEETRGEKKEEKKKR